MSAEASNFGSNEPKTMTEATKDYVQDVTASGNKQTADAAEAIKTAAASAYQRATDLALDLAGSASKHAKGTADTASNSAKNVAAGTADSAKAAGEYASETGKTWSDWARERVGAAGEAVSQ